MDENESTRRRILDVHVDITDTLKLNLVMVQDLWVQGHSRFGST